LQEIEKKSKIERYEGIIRQVRDVLGAKVFLDEEGKISEIHILSSPARNPKQIVRDVVSALLIQAGVDVDHKKISVVQIEEGEEGETVFPNAPLNFASLNYYVRGGDAEATVELQGGPDQGCYQGFASGPHLPGKDLYIVAEATISALTKCGRNFGYLVVEEIKKMRIGRHQVVVAILLTKKKGVQRFLTGAELIQGDDRIAAVQAVLRAFNYGSRSFTI